MNFVANVFKKYINKNETNLDENKETNNAASPSSAHENPELKDDFQDASNTFPMHYEDNIKGASLIDSLDATEVDSLECTSKRNSVCTDLNLTDSIEIRRVSADSLDKDAIAEFSNKEFLSLEKIIINSDDKMTIKNQVDHIVSREEVNVLTQIADVHVNKGAENGQNNGTQEVREEEKICNSQTEETLNMNSAGNSETAPIESKTQFESHNVENVSKEPKDKKESSGLHLSFIELLEFEKNKVQQRFVSLPQEGNLLNADNDKAHKIAIKSDTETSDDNKGVGIATEEIQSEKVTKEDFLDTCTIAEGLSPETAPEIIVKSDNETSNDRKGVGNASEELFQSEKVTIEDSSGICNIAERLSPKTATEITIKSNIKTITDKKDADIVTEELQCEKVTKEDFLGTCTIAERLSPEKAAEIALKSDTQTSNDKKGPGIVTEELQSEKVAKQDTFTIPEGFSLETASEFTIKTDTEINNDGKSAGIATEELQSKKVTNGNFLLDTCTIAEGLSPEKANVSSTDDNESIKMQSKSDIETDNGNLKCGNITEKNIEAFDSCPVKEPESTCSDNPQSSNYDRQETREFETLEREFQDKMETIQKLRIENILDDLVSASNEESLKHSKSKSVNQNPRKLKRQDTKEFEKLEKECVQVVVNDARLRTDEILNKLVLEESVISDSPEVVRGSKSDEEGNIEDTVKGLLTGIVDKITIDEEVFEKIEKETRKLARQDTNEFNKIEEQDTLPLHAENELEMEKTDVTETKDKTIKEQENAIKKEEEKINSSYLDELKLQKETNDNQIKSKNKELQSKVESLQTELESIKKAAKSKLKVAANQENVVAKFKNVLNEFEKQIAKQADDLQKLRIENERNARYFSNTEMAFSDVFEKYERSKEVIAVYKRNEDILIDNLENADAQVIQLENKCTTLKDQSMDQIQRAQIAVEHEKQRYKNDVAKLQAHVRILEIKAMSLELALKQKTEECDALAALCDDITGRNFK